MPRSPSKLIEKREAFRLWFEFLKLAQTSADPRVSEALIKSSAFYERWGDIRHSDFHEWWPTHAYLFEEKFVVRKLQINEKPRDLSALIVEIPLTLSATAILRAVKAIVHEELNARTATTKQSKKVSTPTSDFSITSDTEPKLAAIREMLTVYRDIHLQAPNLRGRKRLQAIHDHYLNRKNKKWRRIPNSLVADLDDDARVASVLRTVSRYIDNAETILLNVANGTFPGLYGDKLTK